MKQANNNEVDLLLRSLAKGRAESSWRNESPSGGGNGTFPDHLDADELNSYAEGLVPAPARERFTEHLADCHACRRVVIDLTQAAGTANRLDASEQQSGQSGTRFWQKLAVFFAPAVLRYAVPAVMLTAVMGIGLFAWLQQRQRDLVARNEPAVTSAPPIQLKDADAPTANSGTVPAPTMQRAEPAATADSLGGRTSLDEKTHDPASRDEPDSAFGMVAPATKDGTAPGKAGDIAAAQQPYAPEPKPGTPAPPPAKVQSEVDETTRLAKEQPAKREDQERQRNLDYVVPSEEHGPNRSAAPRNAPVDTRRAGVGSVRGGPSGEDKKNNKNTNVVESRSVSGRRFILGDNAWIDTAYESSRATTNVPRNSEQFRALVADEPGLRAIAEQLKGVVIVVWKGRAYRIQ